MIKLKPTAMFRGAESPSVGEEARPTFTERITKLANVFEASSVRFAGLLPPVMTELDRTLLSLTRQIVRNDPGTH